MRLLLDEMISPAVARQLRDRGHDVHAMKRDRPDLESLPDPELVRCIGSERRAVVTNDVADFQPLHDQTLRRGEDHFGMVFSYDVTMPRNKASVPLWVSTLGEFLTKRPADDTLRNRVHHLP